MELLNVIKMPNGWEHDALINTMYAITLLTLNIQQLANRSDLLP